jgi:hypothetical protein
MQFCRAEHVPSRERAALPDDSCQATAHPFLCIRIEPRLSDMLEYQPQLVRRECPSAGRGIQYELVGVERLGQMLPPQMKLALGEF